MKAGEKAPAPRRAESRRRISGAPGRSNAAPATAASIIARVKRLGGELIVRDGRLVLRQSSSVPANVVEEIRAHKPALIAELTGSKPAQMALDLPTPAAHSTAGPMRFWEREEARFDRLLEEFGVAPPVARKRSKAAA